MKHRMRLWFPILGVAVLILIAIHVDAASGDAGLVYGEGHAFYVSPPSGWVLDNRAGVGQGLYAVFYPDGSSWKDSPKVMYVNTAKRENGESIADFIAGDVERLRSKSPHLQLASGRPISIPNGPQAELRYFSGDKWNNHEAVAYIQENKIFVTIVLTARNENLDKASRGAFEQLVKSYDFLTDHPEDATDHFDLIKQLAEDNIRNTTAGARYDAEMGKYFGTHHAGTLDHCIKKAANSLSNFDLLVRVSADGRPLDILVDPKTRLSLCVASALKVDRYPPPPAPRYWTHLHMTIDESRTLHPPRPPKLDDLLRIPAQSPVR